MQAPTTALLVVDVQRGVMADCWNAAAVIDRVAHAVQRARTAGAPVIWVQHGDAELQPGTEPWQWAPTLQPAADELQVHKAHNSAFEGTALADELARRGLRHLVLAGAASNWCIRATAYAALERGFHLTLLSDAHTTAPVQLEDGTRIAAEGIVRELNATLRWLSYPGRRNAVATAEAVDFG